VEVAVFSLATHLYWAVWGILQARSSAVLPAPSWFMQLMRAYAAVWLEGLLNGRGD
jgi:hypothetical protein